MVSVQHFFLILYEQINNYLAKDNGKATLENVCEMTWVFTITQLTNATKQPRILYKVGQKTEAQKRQSCSKTL